MQTFKYEVGMTKAEMQERITDLLEHMQTDEFWLARGGNGPYFLEGNELLRKYLDMTDAKKIERKHIKETKMFKGWLNKKGKRASG